MVKKSIFSIVVILLLVFFVAFQTSTQPFSKNQVNRKQDKSLSEYPENVLINNIPGPNQYTLSEPGETAVLERAYVMAPPFIPHNIKNFSMTRENNDCMNCHLEGMEISEGHSATRIPEPHFLNLYKNQKTVDRVTGTRYNCIQCHVPQTDSIPTKLSAGHLQVYGLRQFVTLQ